MDIDEEGDDADDYEDSSGSDDDDVDIEDVKKMERFARTFNNGDYDQDLDDELSLKESGSHIRATQASYNKPNDWVERNRIGLEGMKRQLQSCIDSVLQATDLELRLSHNDSANQLIDNEEPIVWHEPVLDEYWNRLEKMGESRWLTTDIYTIYISNVEMKKERMAALVAMFLSGRAYNSSEKVCFNNANLCKEGIISMSELVYVSPDLRALHLHHNRIDNTESARCLSRSVKSHTGITHLHLGHCNLGSSPEMISVILQSDVRYLGLSNNNIDSLGAVKIVEYLEGNPPIHQIDLDHNQLNDDDALLMSQALRRNTNLSQIWLRSNNFTSIGAKALLNCVFDASSLNAISESNHTLREIHFFYFSSFIDGMLKLDRTQKLMLALQDKDSLLLYLANVPMKLMPEVMAFPHRQVANHCPHKCLNIVYSTMRWWNMPMLYSYHCCVKSDAKRKRTD